MIRNRKLLKAITAFLILETIFSTVAPTISWALTAGPTAPEATSFEPVDTTDMVNLLTGDLAYNIPLLEVPGPGGGYPMSLSYHGGILPNEDASWVGLGWTLNPGAINRNVNGFADDQDDVSNTSRYYWNGGNTEGGSVGVTVGVPGTPASISAGVSISQDTYEGVGVGGQVGIGSQFGPVSAGMTVGVGPYGNAYSSMGVGLTASLRKGETEAALGFGISIDGTNVSSGGSLSMESGGTGATLRTSSQGVTASLGIRGATVSSNSKAGIVSTKSNGFDVPIPVYPGVFLNLGYNYQRYWTDQIEDVSINGALHYPATSPNRAWLDDHDYDTYSLPDPTVDDIDDNIDDPNGSLGGSFPNFDNYAVNAQGLAGYMRPFYYIKNLTRRNTFDKQDNNTNDYKKLQYLDFSTDTKIAEFRFLNDFSNRFEYDAPFINFTQSNPYFNLNFGSKDPITGENGIAAPYSSNSVPGSKQILYFTNSEIINTSPNVVQAGFRETHATGFDRASQSSSLIGGFTIVNESGTKYHFALPAMASTEFYYSERKADQGGKFNDFKKPSPYAYTWFLTSVTGPDYVDRSANGEADGILNEYDWGYWVEFEYGKWTSTYHWRNPSEDQATDIDNEFQSFSEGIKELYYLDAVRTKTHTALFIKDIRNDAKSTRYLRRNYKRTYSYFESENSRKDEMVTDTKLGGFIPKSTSCRCEIVVKESYTQKDIGQLNYYALPTSTLKLSSVVLINNIDLDNVNLTKAHGSQYQQKFTHVWSTEFNSLDSGYEQCNFDPLVNDHHLYQNVLDVYDYQSILSEITPHILRKVDFITDYSLAPNTANSFAFTPIVSGGTPATNASAYPLTGKLTLKELQFLGRTGVKVLPSTKFSYDEQGIYGVAALKNFTMSVTNSGLVPGDLISIKDSQERKTYALITKIEGSSHSLKYIGASVPLPGDVQWQKTKNPPYNKDAYDMWGFYKSDYDASAPNDGLLRRVSEISSKSLDVWSLREIKNPVGSKVKIEYQPDSYIDVGVGQQNLFRIKKVAYLGNNKFEIFLHESLNGTDYFSVDENENGNNVSVMVDSYFRIDEVVVPIEGDEQVTESDLYDCEPAENPQTSYPVHVPVSTSDDGNVKEIRTSTNSIVIEDARLYSELTKRKRGHLWSKGRCKKPDNTHLGHSYTFTEKTYHWLLTFEGYPDYIGGGVVSPSKKVKKFGGGVAVSAVSVVTPSSAHKTSYQYNEGVTTYEPYVILPPMIADGLPVSSFDFFDDKLKVEMARPYKRQLASARELPAPGVMYGEVRVDEHNYQQEEIHSAPYYTKFKFTTFDEGMFGIDYGTRSDDAYSENPPSYDIVKIGARSKRSLTLKDYTSRIGSLISTTLYEKESNRKLSETINHYLFDGIEQELDGVVRENPKYDANKLIYEPRLKARFNNQGVIEETFADARLVRQRENHGDYTNTFALQGVVSKREQYPNVKVGQSTKDYRTGISTRVDYNKYDFLSGQLTSSQSTDELGNVFLTEITPAFRKYASMGQYAQGGRNMLSQEAGSTTYRIDPTTGEKLALVGATAQTWSDQISVLTPGASTTHIKQNGIWRLSSSYVFVGNDNIGLRPDGLYSLSNFAPFTGWLNEQMPAGWQKNSQITMYDVNSNGREAVDLYGHYAISIFSQDNSQFSASVVNASYNEVVHANMEGPKIDGVLSNIQIEQGTLQTTNVHTGTQALEIGSQKVGFEATCSTAKVNRDRYYHLSFWVKSALDTPKVSLLYRFTPLVSGPTEYNEKTFDVKKISHANGWYLYNIDLPIPKGTDQQITVLSTKILNRGASQIYIDDLRIHPFESSMSSYVYNKFGELWYILNSNNMYVEYKYDEQGRLTDVYREDFSNGGQRRKLSNAIYHHANN